MRPPLVNYIMNYPTKEQIEYDYYDLNMTQKQIAIKYGFKTRQPIGKLFKKYNIQSRTKSQIAKTKDTLNNPTPPKEVIEKLYKNTNSISEVARILNVSRNRATSWIKSYNIEINYFKNNICNETLFKELHSISVKEAAIKYNISTTKIKLRVPHIPKLTYTKERLKEIISLYDVNNQGFPKAIIFDDENVYNSILEETKDHILFGEKITERVYRILNDFSVDKKVVCNSCGKDIKFYTIDMGYGNSELKICNHCVAKQSAVSKPSQELFWEIFKSIDTKDFCFFSELNYEKSISISDIDKKVFSHLNKLNKSRYVLDFIFKNKIIEFDGTYWHLDEEKEETKDIFLKSKGFDILHITDKEYFRDKSKTLNKCIEFLTK